MDRKYMQFITDLKQAIVQSRYIAARLANKEQLFLYYKTGKMLSEKIAVEKWGAKILEQVANDLQQQLPGLKGFSVRNLKKMCQFATEYMALFESIQIALIGPSLTAQLEKPPKKAFMPSLTAQIQNTAKEVITPSPTAQLEAFFGISFTHHVLLLNKCNTLEERFFYIEQAANNFWSVRILDHHIESNLYAHQGKLPNNFNKTLPDTLKPSALQVFQDQYLMDFIATEEDDDERVFESKVVSDIRNFIMRMGKGFSFIGNQYRLEVGGEEFFIDLLFFNRYLQSLVAFELKRGKFKPADAGQLNFYLNVLDEMIKLPHENPSVGIVLCKEKNNTVVEFAVKTLDKAMGVATYRTTKEVPKEMKGILPNARDLAKLM